MDNHKRALWCSQCHNPSGDTRFVCRLETEIYMGDHSETYTQAAGVFCSRKCLAEWTGAEGVLSEEGG